MAAVTSRDGTHIAFERVGTGPTLILVDAAGGFRRNGPMPSLAEHLAGSFTVVTYDRRGRGESGDTLPYAVDREVEDLASLIGANGGAAFVHGFSSGAALALLGAAARLPISALSLLEPPIVLDQPPHDDDLAAEIEALVTAGRRADAVEHFSVSIGVPAEIIKGMRQAPFFPLMESVAHTLAYDCRITPAVTRATLTSVTAPSLVISSEASDDRLRGWAQAVAAALPEGHHLALKGEWHGVPNETLAPALTDFFRHSA
ncbi:alpha/beta fold hydrolase [Sinosporangium siamense]|uniref:Alpha/beta hydrolase n=1 Tax=Sinosporangium siamense TaxID=1367973 RepID=A0A919RGQ2_9ACTN|nr:alpha/beta fold hydrolase [Sinosporangium siamense]GII93427.1 alpha/beta hydrolase [Sinosporangium siamense]